MKRVTGIGGIFFAARAPAALRKFGWVIDPEGNKVELWEPPPGR